MHVLYPRKSAYNGYITNEIANYVAGILCTWPEFRQCRYTSSGLNANVCRTSEVYSPDIKFNAQFEY